MDNSPPIVIVGGGSTAALLAINLAGHPGRRVMLIERVVAREGCGVAFGTRHPAHVLNVRAAGMSAFPDDSGHFARWLESHDKGAPADFVSRGVYGRYLCDLLAAAKANAPGRIECVTGNVTAIVRRSQSYHVVLSNGRAIEAARVVLSPGNLPPTVPDWLPADVADSPAYIDDPWTDEVDQWASGDARALVLGTGLSAIDTVLRLHSGRFGGKITCLSRRGLTPRRHLREPRPLDMLDTPPPPVLSTLVHELRHRAADIGWHSAVDELRPVTQRLWQSASIVARARFFRHLRPYWDVHRHRLSPTVADTFEGLVDSGLVRVISGRVVAAARSGDAVVVQWRARGGHITQTMRADMIINCTGPQTDIRRSREPLLVHLLKAGLIRPDPLAMGIDVDTDCRVIDARGVADSGLYCIGPMTRGAFWEIVAIPDIRHQCADIARRLASDAHGRRGEI